jgi:signal recognition particle GTPase
MKAENWVSSSALLNRMNFALALAASKVRGVKVDAMQLAGSPPAPADANLVLSTMEAKLLSADVSKQTHDSIVAQIEGQKSGTTGQQDMSAQKKGIQAARPPDAGTIAGLLLGSPEFQRR